MKYQININHEFATLDDLARYLGQVLVEIEKKRDGLGFRGLDEEGDTLSGEDWDIELNEV